MTNPTPPSLTSPPWSTASKRLIALGAILALYLFLRRVDQSVFLTIAVTFILSYMLSPVVTFFERRMSGIQSYGTRRSLSVLLTWLLVIGGIAVFIALVVPVIFVQLRAFAEDLPDLLQNTEADIKEALDKRFRVGEYTINPWDELQQLIAPPSADGQETTLTQTLQDAVLRLSNPALDILGGVLSALLDLFFILVMLFYLMRDGPIFAAGVVNAVPESYQGDVRLLLHELGLIWNAYLRGQIILCLAIAAVVFTAALILGLPQPILLGIVAGFLEFIPNLGPALALIPAVMFSLTADSATIPSLQAGPLYALVVILTYTSIQQLEAMFLVPRVLGRSLDLHPFVILVAILIGANVAGIVGVVLAAPSVATIRLLARYLRSKLLDEEVFTIEPAYVRQRGMIFRLIYFFLGHRFPVAPQADRLIEPRREVVESADAASRAS